MYCILIFCRHGRFFFFLLLRKTRKKGQAVLHAPLFFSLLIASETF
jgi:hypothetical protein